MITQRRYCHFFSSGKMQRNAGSLLAPCPCMSWRDYMGTCWGYLRITVHAGVLGADAIYDQSVLDGEA
jgi:hypothetical protein